MSDPSDDSARPAKRARLDDNTAPTFSAETSAPAPQATAIDLKATSITAIDADLEREVRAGITEYVCPDNLGFTGILKQRYTDFLVNEIGLDGEVLHLRSTDVPRKEGKEANGRHANGANSEKEDVKEDKIVVKEEKGDAEMLDVQNGVDTRQKVPIKTEDAPAQEDAVVKQEGDQEVEVKQEDVKQELEEVGFQYMRLPTTVLTDHSLPIKIAIHYTRYSAKTSQNRLSNSSDRYEDANTEKQKTSKLSLHRPLPTRRRAHRPINRYVVYSQIC